MIEKPEPVERAQAAEMKRDGAGAAAREGQADLGGGGLVHAGPKPAQAALDLAR